MLKWLEALAYLDIVDPIDGFVATFHYADWDGAYERAGILGLIMEFFASLGALNCWKIWVSRDSDWSGVTIEKFLTRYGVRIWGRGFLGDQIFFRVKKRQARWAEYLLLRRGIPVTSSSFDARNIEYARRHAPDSEPPNRKTRSIHDWVEQLLDLFR